MTVFVVESVDRDGEIDDLKIYASLESAKGSHEWVGMGGTLYRDGDPMIESYGFHIVEMEVLP